MSRLLYLNTSRFIPALVSLTAVSQTVFWIQLAHWGYTDPGLSKNKRYAAIVGSLSCCGMVLYFIRALGRGRVREVTLLSDRKVRIKTSIPFITEELAAHQLSCREPLAIPKIEGNVVTVSSESVLTGPRLCLYQSGRRLPFELDRSGHFPFPEMWDRLFFKKIKT